MLCLRLRAPFAAFRDFSAGYYRATAPFVPPSAAYGLLLNIAGIESRLDDGKSPMTLMKSDLPTATIAIGVVRLPRTASLYQQAHNYPVGTTGKGRLADAKGNKYNIQPVRRELLADIDGYICLDRAAELEASVREGLRQESRFASDDHARYGLPFLGDNNFLISKLHEERELQPAYWFTLLRREEATEAANVCRMTIWIDRKDMTQTISHLYSRTPTPVQTIPEAAWTVISPSQSQVAPK